MPFGTAIWHSHLSDDNVTESGRLSTDHATKSNKARTMQPKTYFSKLDITYPHVSVVRGLQLTNNRTIEQYKCSRGDVRFVLQCALPQLQYYYTLIWS